MSDDASGGGSFSDYAELASEALAGGADGDTVAGEERSFLQQLWASIVGILFGFVAIGLGLGVIVWNENNSVQIARALNEGLGVTIAAPADRVDPGLEGKMVHLTAALASQRGVRDDLLNVAGQGLRLRREVEMFQWKESSSTKDGRTTYTYNRDWSSSPQDSSRFRDAANHRNPAFPFRSQTFTATDAMIGPYRLGAAALEQFQPRSESRLTPPQAATDAIGRRLNRPATVTDDRVYFGRDAADPAVGDLRISWKLIAAGPGSVAARQTAGELTAYTARNGRPVLLAATGTHSAEAMFAQGQADNRVFTWIVRLACLFGIFIGFLLLLGPFTFLASYIPIVGDLFAAGAAVIALVMTLVVGGGAIALAWFAVRPLLTLGIVVGVLASIAGLKWLTRGRAEQKLAGRQAPAMQAR